MNSNNEKLLKELCVYSSESEWLEFKVDNANPDEIGEYLSALSNSACLHDKRYGYLVFGVEDKTHKVVGTNFKPRETKVGNEELENWLSRLLTPRIDFKIIEFNFDGKPIVILKVDAVQHQPVAFKGNAFVRVGSYKKKLRDFPEKERKIWNKSNHAPFETEVAKSDLTDDQVLRLLDYPTYFRLTKQNLPSNKEGIIDRLESENFVIRDNGRFKILNLGAILFANNLNEFTLLKRKALRVIVYPANDRLNAVKEWVSEKGYAIDFENIVAYIVDQLPQNEVIDLAFRKIVKMYPDIAIRELVANALIHQDFSQKGTGSMVEIFKTRIEITNPGEPLIDTLRFIDHSPKSRNEILASFFRRIDLCEERGSGIDKVITAIEAYQLPAPRFYAGDDYFRAFLFAHKTFREMDRTERLAACYQHSCLKFVLGDLMSNQSLRERFKIDQKNYSMVSRLIKEAIKEGAVKEDSSASKSNKLARYIPFWA